MIKAEKGGAAGDQEQQADKVAPFSAPQVMIEQQERRLETPLQQPSPMKEQDTSKKKEEGESDVGRLD